MRLTTFSDYSLRVLMYLGVRRAELVTIAEIAAAYAISQNHLMKVVHLMAQRGYIETQRGKGGGIQLALDPAAIGIGDVLRTTEESIALVECFEPDNADCRIQAACALKGVLREATDAFFAELDRYTLADLLKPAPRLKRILVNDP